MKNPYEILEISQDASNAEILKAMTSALRKKKYTSVEIAQARTQLSKPATRLAADFTFPIFEPFDGLKPLESTIDFEIVDIDSIDPNVYNSL